MLYVANTPFGTVRIQLFIIDVLRAEHQIELSGSRTLILFNSLFTYVRASYIIFIYRLTQCHPVDTHYRRIDQSGFGKLSHNPHDTSGTIYILNMILLCIRRHLTQAWALA